MGPHPAVAQIRVSVRRCLGDLAPGCLVLAACSGGPDSLALAAALAYAAPRLGLRGGGVTIDHGLQPGSAERAARVQAVLAGLGLDPVHRIAVTVPAEPGHGGPEAAARAARYAALEQAARESAAAAVLLGHTQDDQAETVLLGLARGSGARSLAGMPAQRGLLRRPLLTVSRAVLREACQALGLDPWDDPHNVDPAYTRARVRHQVMPVLEQALGPGVAAALARTAAQLSDDSAALDAVAHAEARRLAVPGLASGGPGGAGVGAAALDGAGPDGAEAGGAGLGALDVAGLAALAPAVRARVLRLAALAAGCPGGSLAARHIAAADALVTGWHGQRWADLPGGVRVRRQYGKLLFSGRAGNGGAAGTD